MTGVDRAAGRDKCGARTRSGSSCARPAGWGTDHAGTGRCKLHGGNTPTHRAAARRAEAERDVVLFGAKRDVHPAEALLELVQWKAGEVDYWRARVKELEDVDVVWGITKEQLGGEQSGTTYEAKPSIEYSMLREAERDLASYAAAALKAGVDERRVRLAESYGHQITVVIQAILRGLHTVVVAALEALEVAGPEAVAAFKDTWAAAVAEVVPRELRAIVAGPGEAA